ncbi:MAG: DUF2786 domain-containing protein [Provencibacterium sp.]|nr:DUF2786 domain-containing protein [Provencibacterium sp.]
MDIKDKINKLLALSQSPNEHEAELALCKAKELMIEHKLSMQDLTADGVQVIHHETAFTYSKRRSSWMLQLANVIAEKHCCRAFCRRRSRQQTRTVCLAGFPEDVRLCEKSIGYALDCIHSWTRRIVRLNHKLYSTKEMGCLSDSYAKGYIAGLYVACHRLSKLHENERALVPAAHSAVDKSVAGLKEETIAAGDSGIIRSVYNVGFSDGIRFCMADKLEAKR